MEQQRPPPSEPSSGRRLWFQSCMVSPMMLWPSRTSNPATVELSTPPLIATVIVFSGMGGSERRNLSQMRHRVRYSLDQDVDLLWRVGSPERKSDAGARPLRREADSQKHVGGLDRSARACGPARNCESPQIERDHHGL